MSDNNPYAAPAASLEPGGQGDPGRFRLTNPKAVSIGRGWGWIAEGFGHFKKSPGAWILTIILGIVIMVVMSVIPIIGQIAFMVTYYVWFGGFMIGCHAQANGDAFEVKHLFAGFTKPGKLIVLSLVMTVISIGIMVAAMGPIYLQLLQGGLETDPAVMEAISDPSVFLLRFLIALLVMIPVMMAIWFVPALIAINDLPLVSAMKLSFIGCLRNILPFLLYGVLGLILYVVAAIPLLLGLLVLFPTMIASIYTSYRDIFTEASTANV